MYCEEIYVPAIMIGLSDRLKSVVFLINLVFCLKGIYLDKLGLCGVSRSFKFTLLLPSGAKDNNLQYATFSFSNLTILLNFCKHKYFYRFVI